MERIFHANEYILWICTAIWIRKYELVMPDINFVRGHLEDESMDYSGGLV